MNDFIQIDRNSDLPFQNTRFSHRINRYCKDHETGGDFQLDPLGQTNLRIEFRESRNRQQRPER